MASASSPRSKNVAFTFFCLRMSRIGPVYWLGPSSKVSAMTFLPSGCGENDCTVSFFIGSTVRFLISCFDRLPIQISSVPSSPCCVTT